jgi:hypothetical protein
MADCNNCDNRGKIYGLSQESNCEHCVHSDKWRKDLYKPKPAKDFRDVCTDPDNCKRCKAYNQRGTHHAGIPQGLQNEF